MTYRKEDKDVPIQETETQERELSTSDLSLSNTLREKLGIVQEANRLEFTICTTKELRALRYMLRLTLAQFATQFGVSKPSIRHWESGLRPVKIRGVKQRESLLQAIQVARDLGALTHVSVGPAPGPAPGSQPKYTRPPTNMLYKCTSCGKDLKWHNIRIIQKDGKETLEHGRKGQVCGPVMAGGLVHKSQTLEAIQWQKVQEVTYAATE